MAAPRYASAHAYLDALPDGMASFPECKAKASLLRDMLASRPIQPDAAHLPSELYEIIRAPPPVSSWIPEVALTAVAQVIYDDQFGGDDLHAFVDWVYDVNRALLRKPLYRVLFLFISPRRLVTNVASRWGAFHRGTTLTLFDVTDKSARLRLEFPANLYSAEMFAAFGAAWRAAIELAGAFDVRSELERTTDSAADYSVRWH